MAFLGYRRVFSEELAGDPRIREAFERALTDLHDHGVRTTLDRMTGS